MRAHELFEYKLLKNEANLRIWVNPTSIDIKAILKNSWIANNVSDFNPEEDDEMDYLRGYVHGLDYPLRGLIMDNTVYIVDSYYADHDTLVDTLGNEGLLSDSEKIPLVIEKHEEGKLSGVRDNPNDYMIGVPPKYADIVKNIPTVKMMKLPIAAWS